jgi:hypothetical protein
MPQAVMWLRVHYSARNLVVFSAGLAQGLPGGRWTHSEQATFRAFGQG